MPSTGLKHNCSVEGIAVFLYWGNCRIEIVFFSEQQNCSCVSRLSEGQVAVLWASWQLSCATQVSFLLPSACFIFIDLEYLPWMTGFKVAVLWGKTLSWNLLSTRLPVRCSVSMAATSLRSIFALWAGWGPTWEDSGQLCCQDMAQITLEAREPSS